MEIGEIGGKWGSCSEKSCGEGTKRRNRQCNSPQPDFNGKPCPGNPKQTDKCCTTTKCKNKWSKNKCKKEKKKCKSSKKVRNNCKKQCKAYVCKGSRDNGKIL